jgi:hypothetical protein
MICRMCNVPLDSGQAVENLPGAEEIERKRKEPVKGSVQ